eukprot:218153-Prymnesium_polylepis.2
MLAAPTRHPPQDERSARHARGLGALAYRIQTSSRAPPGHRRANLHWWPGQSLRHRTTSRPRERGPQSRSNRSSRPPHNQHQSVGTPHPTEESTCNHPTRPVS